MLNSKLGDFANAKIGPTDALFRADADDSHAGVPRRSDPAFGVFDDNATRRRNGESPRRDLKNLRIRLGTRCIISVHDLVEE